MDELQQDATNGESRESASPIAGMVAEVSRALTQVEPAAFVVVPRVLRRVVKQECELPAMTIQVPHRKCWVIDRIPLIKHVDYDELGLKPGDPLPDKAILLARPDDKHLESMSLGQLKQQVWRLLYHAKIHLEFDRLIAAERLSVADLRQRIDALGQVEFDEIQTVLRRENFVHGETSSSEIYIEFAALYSELKHFAPHCLGSYFPSFEDYSQVDELLNRDVDTDALFAATRLNGAPAPLEDDDSYEIDETDKELDSLTGHSNPPVGQDDDDSEDGFPALLEQVLPRIQKAPKSSLSGFGRLIRKADKAFSRGNAVAAALYQIRAAKIATPELVHEALSGALTDVQRLVKRLQDALDFDESTAHAWYESLVGLLLHATSGFWNADKRLLYDLQKVCVDHEREIYTVDLVGCAASFGKRPIKRELPNQREVLMSKHLRSATRRLISSRLTGDQRRRLSQLLHEAAESADHQMRTRLRPLTTESLASVGLVPRDIPEKVAFYKLSEELLDGVANRGFLTMGELRDAVSRSNLKLEDLSGPKEFLLGDRLLKADKELSRTLDGVYQRGDIYLRWLQRLSASSFGTIIGRFLTRFVAIPYGGAFLCLEAVVHIAELFFNDEELKEQAGQAIGDVLSVSAMSMGVETSSLLAQSAEWALTDDFVGPFEAWWSQWNLPIILALGTFFLLLMHVRKFRRLVSSGLRSLFRLLRRTLYEWPVRFVRQKIVRSLLRSTPFVLFRKFVFWPMIPTVIICGLMPLLYGAAPDEELRNWGVVLAAMSVLLNSRVGRDVEELTAEWAHSTWTRIRVHIFVALFDFIMDSFKRLLEWFDRVLYAVDEWLRFKSGETTVSLSLKAILGVFWTGFTFVARFCVNLLIEPQINPIKHFPVVTVSHKLLLPLAPTFLDLLTPIVGGRTDLATMIVSTTVVLVPGVFGFMAWELKSNWQLYRANRGRHLKPVLVGSHGETFIRLMKPGFHSGTLPKLFSKLRRVDRHRSGSEHSLARSRYLDQLHHVHIAVEHFVVREFLELLRETPAWSAGDVVVQRIRLASNNIRIELVHADEADDPMILAFEEQSGWLVAGISQAGWVDRIPDDQRNVLFTALIGFYRLAGVDLIREQIAAGFPNRNISYDINEEGLIVWPEPSFGQQAVYNLRHSPIIRPYPRQVVREFELPAIDAHRLVFAETRLEWETWATQWDNADFDGTNVMPENIRWSLKD